MGFPPDLSRTFLTLVVPGIVALAPWVLLSGLHTSATSAFERFPALAHVVYFAGVAVVGSLCNGVGTFIEAWFDKRRDVELGVTEHWYDYLSRPIAKEPVGYRYVGRLFTALSFELSMCIASPFFVLGSALLAARRFPNVDSAWLVVGTIIALFVVMGVFMGLASFTHRTLCRTRRELMTRLPKAV